jgi:hypothetical protein
LEELDCLYVNGERYPFGGIVGDPETATRREAIKECIAALTAPGATTKSDGGGKLEPAECPQDRSCAREPIGNTASSGQAVPGVAPGPSDPSSTRSEVTVESLAACVEQSGFVVIGRFEAAILARALLDQFEIRRK